MDRNRLFLGLKSRELESRANTKEICEKMTQKIGNCLGIRIGVQIVGRRLIITFSILRSGKLEKYKGGVLKIQKWLYV